MPTILISGAASGIGAAFVAAYSHQPTNRIIAIDRQSHPPPDLLNPSSSPTNNITYYQVDVTSLDSIELLATSLAKQPIDLLIHSAGIRGLEPSLESQNPNDIASCETMQVLTPQTILSTFQTNALGTFLLIRALLPNLRLSSQARLQTTLSKVVVMSSRMGSLSANTTGGAYAYRASKAALNAIVRSFSVDVEEVVFVLCHPGRVRSGLVKCVEVGAIQAGESVEGLLGLIDRWGREESGLFFDRFGERIEW